MNGEVTDPSGIAVRLSHIELRCPDHEARIRALEDWMARAKGAWWGISIAAGTCAAGGSFIAGLVSKWLSHGG